MFKLFVVFIFLVAINPSVFANSCPFLPDYILDADILSCKLVDSDSTENSQSVVVNVYVVDEISFSSTRPISSSKLLQDNLGVSKFPLKDKEVALIFENGEFSCRSARFYKDYQKGATFYVAALCCSAGSPWCPEANHQGFRLPIDKTILGEESSDAFDRKFDFSKSDIGDIN